MRTAVFFGGKNKTKTKTEHITAEHYEMGLSHLKKRKRKKKETTIITVILAIRLHVVSGNRVKCVFNFDAFSNSDATNIIVLNS